MPDLRILDGPRHGSLPLLRIGSEVRGRGGGGPSPRRDARGPPARPPEPGLDDRSLGLLLFDAEESLARGSAEKALVAASKAAQERPDSLTARALVDRARKALLRGRRRERLEARLREAETLFGRGDAGAERIVMSALKVVPDHPLALDLFRRLKERRLGGGTVEAEAERELAALARMQIPRTVLAARAALAAGWEAKALLAIRRGLRLVPDDPELLGLLGEIQNAAATQQGGRSRRHALVSQVRDGLEILRRGQIGESLKILRAVLLEDPDNARAQAAIQEVRRAWLERSASGAGADAAGTGPVPVPAPSPTPRKPLEREAAPPPAPLHPRPEAPPAPADAALRPGASRPGVADAPIGIPREILLPRRRRRETPVGLVLLGGAGILGFVGFLATRMGQPAPARQPAAPVPPSLARPQPPRPEPPAEEHRGPLSGLDARLRGTIEETLASYARALERADATLLAASRPDLTPREREHRLAPFVGALNAATDIRVLDVKVQGETAVVPILRTDVIVGGASQGRPPTEETLRFERRHGTWVLR